MDVGRPKHRKQIEDRGLLFGIVAYAAGRLGREPVRSQGHIHKASRYSGWSTPEIFEIWQGRALILMQEFAGDDPGRSIAVDARLGDRVVVPPSWAHAVISADADQPLVFGAWCVRDYGFVYDGVRAHGGLAWFPVLEDDGTIPWIRNRRYQPRELTLRPARAYPEMGLDPGISLYDHIEVKPDAICWVSRPDLIAGRWREFEP
jgi:glucose-6-phosphate isomerase